MHDPLTLAFDLYIPLPWKRWKGKGLSSFARIPLITIWHKDPCRDGSDSSCRVTKRMTKKQKDHIEWWGQDEGKSPWFCAERARETQRPSDAETLLRGALWHVTTSWGLHRWSIRHKRLTFGDVAQLASGLLHDPNDNVRSSLCLLPGWHTNDKMLVEVPDSEDFDVNSPEYDAHMDAERVRDLSDYPLEASKYGKESRGKSFYEMLARILKHRTARWWHHSRWHVHHWRIQFSLWNRINRRFFERCDKCRKRFKGATVFGDWGGTRKWCEPCDGMVEMKIEFTPSDVVPKEES